MAKGTLSIRTDAKTLAKLDRLAKAINRPRSWVINEAIQIYLDVEGSQIELILEGVADADAGRKMPHTEVMRQLDDKLSVSSAQLRVGGPPEARARRLLRQALRSPQSKRDAAWRRLLATLRRGYALGGERLEREALYEERVPRAYRGSRP